MAKAYVKRSPTVVQIPGNGQAIQLPVSDDSIISISNIGTVALALSTDESFNNTWPIAVGEVQPEPGVDNLWAMNTSGTDSEVLVLTYDARFPGLVAPPTGVSSGGYASLTGPGVVNTPGDLTQLGGFVVIDSAGHGIQLLNQADNLLLALSLNALLSAPDATAEISGEEVFIVASDTLLLQGNKLQFFSGTTGVTQGSIVGMLSAVTDANARAVLSSIVNQLDRLNLILNGTT